MPRAKRPSFPTIPLTAVRRMCPMIVPELNPQHADVIEYQRGRLGTKVGFVTVKPNCSIQSYVPALTALYDLKPSRVVVSTIRRFPAPERPSSAGPEMVDNVIPYIGGEEEKSEQEPLKIWGHLENGVIVPAKAPIISAHCVRGRGWRTAIWRPAGATLKSPQQRKKSSSAGAPSKACRRK